MPVTTAPKTATAAQRTTLARITTDLHAASIEGRVTREGDLLTDFYAMSQRFRFRIDPQGTVTERSCHADPGGILARPEMEILRTLAERELAFHGRGHLAGGLDGTDALCVLGRAEIKLALALETNDALTGEERGVLAGILTSYEQGVREDWEAPGIGGLLNLTLAAIHRKLGV